MQHNLSIYLYNSIQQNTSKQPIATLRCIENERNPTMIYHRKVIVEIYGTERIVWSLKLLYMWHQTFDQKYFLPCIWKYAAIQKNKFDSITFEIYNGLKIHHTWKQSLYMVCIFSLRENKWLFWLQPFKTDHLKNSLLCFITEV